MRKRVETHRQWEKDSEGGECVNTDASSYAARKRRLQTERVTREEIVSLKLQVEQLTELVQNLVESKS